MMAAAAKVWRSRFVAFSWQRALSFLVGVTVGLALLSAGLELCSAGISGLAETNYLRIETKEILTTTDLRARKLSVRGLTSLRLPGGRVLTGNGLALSIGDDGKEDRFTSIRHFSIPAGSNITFAIDPAEGRLSVKIQSNALHFQVIPWPGTQVQIDGDACPAASCDLVFKGSGSFYATAERDSPLEMRMNLDDAPMSFADRVSVSAVQLWELEHLPGTVEVRGAVKNGSFRLLEAPDQTVTLERGSVVDFEPAGLILRCLEVRGDSVYVQLSGRIRNLAVKIGDSELSLMPTWFDLLSHKRYVQVGVGILTLLVGGGLPLLLSLAKSPSSTSPPSGDAPSLEEPAASSRAESMPEPAPSVKPSSSGHQPDVPNPMSGKQEANSLPSTGNRS